MFKKCILGILCTIMMVPYLIGAETAPTREKINVYIFHGDGCGFCAQAFAFFESIEKEYGQYYNLIRFETWKNQENAEIHNKIAAHYKVDDPGVPLILIGDKYFNGYNNVWNDDIKQAIMAEYNKEERSSVVADFVKDLTPDNVPATSKDEKESDVAILVTFGLVTAGVIGLIIFARKRSED